jgi:hypothetical protein
MSHTKEHRIEMFQSIQPIIDLMSRTTKLNDVAQGLTEFVDHTYGRPERYITIPILEP